MQILIDARTNRRGSLVEWIEAFTAIWRAGRHRLDDFMSLFDPGIKLSAPGLRSTVGHAAGLDAFRKTFGVFPDMTASIEGWGCNGHSLFVEMGFSATIGGKLVRWQGVDRFRIHNEAIVERTAFLDPLVVRRALLANPTGWRQLMRLRSSGV